jgi:hypothetical protein
MILDFELEEPVALDNLDPPDVLSLSRHTLFWGTQKLIVGEIDFSRSGPLLWAVHQMREVMHRLDVKQREPYLFDPRGAGATITFSFEGNEVNISGRASTISSRTEWEQRSASVSSEELYASIDRYSMKVYNTVLKIYPPCHDRSFRGWIFGEHKPE